MCVQHQKYTRAWVEARPVILYLRGWRLTCTKKSYVILDKWLGNSYCCEGRLCLFEKSQKIDGSP